MYEPVGGLLLLLPDTCIFETIVPTHTPRPAHRHMVAQEQGTAALCPLPCDSQTHILPPRRASASGAPGARGGGLERSQRKKVVRVCFSRHVQWIHADSHTQHTTYTDTHRINRTSPRYMFLLQFAGHRAGLANTHTCKVSVLENVQPTHRMSTELVTHPVQYCSRAVTLFGSASIYCVPTVVCGQGQSSQCTR